MVLLVDVSMPPNSISIGSAILHSLLAHKHADHGTFGMCSNGLHLYYRSLYRSVRGHLFRKLSWQHRHTNTQTHNSRADRLLYLAIEILCWYATWTFNFSIPGSNSCFTCASYSIYFCYRFCRREVTSRVPGNHYHAHLYSEWRHSYVTDESTPVADWTAAWSKQPTLNRTTLLYTNSSRRHCEQRGLIHYPA